MYIDSLSLRQTVPNCLRLTPTIAHFVVPTMFGYTLWLMPPRTVLKHYALFPNDKGKGRNLDICKPGGYSE